MRPRQGSDSAAAGEAVAPPRSDRRSGRRRFQRRRHRAAAPRRESSTRPPGSRSAPRPSEVQDVANQVVDVTDSYDGIVLDSQVTTDQAGARAEFSLEIPYSQLDAALSDLSGLADVISRTEGGEDITAKAVRAQRSSPITLDQIRKARIALIEADTHEERLVIKSQIDSLNASADAYRTELNGVKRQGRFATVDVEISSNEAALRRGRRLEPRRRLPRRRPRARGDRRDRPRHPRGDAPDLADRTPRLGVGLKDARRRREPSELAPIPPGRSG